MKKDLKKIFKALEDQGWRIDRRGKHVKCKPPSGPIVTVPSTPSDHRSLLNSRAQLRRAGAVL